MKRGCGDDVIFYEIMKTGGPGSPGLRIHLGDHSHTSDLGVLQT